MAVRAPILVLDANILIRAVLGTRVRGLIETYGERIHLLTPAVCMDDARKYLPDLLAKKGIPTETGLAVLAGLMHLLHIAPIIEYAIAEQEAKQRLEGRDPNDWDVLALALQMNAPLWTEDQDFFGVGIATWSSRLVERFLATAIPAAH